MGFYVSPDDVAKYLPWFRTLSVWHQLMLGTVVIGGLFLLIGWLVAKHHYAQQIEVLNSTVGHLRTLIDTAPKLEIPSPQESHNIRSREWPALSPKQIGDLRNRIAGISGMPVRKIQIVREDLVDCVDLAEDIAKAFRQAGWEVSDMDRLWEPLPLGIKIVGPRDDARRSVLLAALGDVLGSDFDLSIDVDKAHPWGNVVPDAMVIRIAIGRRPRL